MTHTYFARTATLGLVLATTTLLAPEPWLPVGEAAGRGATPSQGGATDALGELLAGGGVRFEPEAGRFSIEGRIATRDDLLEFLLVGSSGSAYESLLVTDADPTLLNTAILALGLEPGRNARWVEVDDGAEVAPGDGERPDAAGQWLADRRVRLEAPSGDGLMIHVGWSLDGEDYLFRAEDLIGNIEANAPLPRQRWTFIGSRFVPDPDGQGEVFLAALEQNLVNIAWFPEGNTIATGTPAICARQDVWVGNPWLVPEPGTPVRILFTREPLVSIPPEVAATLPEVGGADREGSGVEAR
jgi:hypothetical protein